MSPSIHSTRWASLLLAAALAFAPAVAQASELDDAKTRGQIGERFDGYLGVVEEPAPSNVKALVEDINRQRRTQYEKVAEKNNVALAQVGRVAGAKLIERTKQGQFVLPNDSDGWIQQQGVE